MKSVGAQSHLTRREREVAKLAAEGLTNRQIGKRLSVSERTVRAHLEQARDKLGATSRATLAAVLTQRHSASRPAVPPLPADNLRSDLGSLVGRQRDLGQAMRLLQAHRLVTLTGPGGVGKTRLALEAARSRTLDWEGSVYMVELAGISNGGAVDQAVLSALKIHDESGRPAREVVADRLYGLDALLLADNCEHLIEAAASLIEFLLATCPQMAVLATSREPLRLAGERVWQVQPLGLPDPRLPLEADALVRHAALRLFKERATEAGGPFQITGADVEAVAQICHRLDGMPLAIELAAARTRMMPLAEILAGLEDRFRLLGVGWRTAEARQRTLRAVTDWSYRLLTAEEAMLFDRLSVFAGSFSLLAAERVGGRPPLRTDAVLGLLSGLVDKSLVVTLAASSDKARYRLLETLRAYGMARLTERGESPAALASLADVVLEGPLSNVAADPELSEIRLELDNIRAASEWSCGQRGPRAAKLAADAGYALGGLGLLGEARTRLERALIGFPEPSADRAWMLLALAWIVQRQRDYEAVANLVAEAKAIALEVGDDAVLQRSFFREADLARHSGKFEAALSPIEQSMYLSRRLTGSSPVGLAIRGQVRGFLGDYLGARSDLEQGIAEAKRLGADGDVGYARAWLAEVALHHHDPTSAAPEISQALSYFRNFGDDWRLAYCLGVAAWLAAQQGDARRALRLAGASWSLWNSIGAKSPLAFEARIEDGLRSARRALGPRAMSAWREGLETDSERAVGYALGETEWSLPPAAESHSPGGLTRRELQVAALLADGLADKQIAARLGIATRTAEDHVDNLRSKLGYSSRSQVAVWASEHGLREKGSP